MKTELINEFYMVQQSRVANKYQEALDQQVYTPIKTVNKRMSAWVSDRGHMLMDLEMRLNSSLKHLRKKYLKF